MLPVGTGDLVTVGASLGQRTSSAPSSASRAATRPVWRTGWPSGRPVVQQEARVITCRVEGEGVVMWEEGVVKLKLKEERPIDFFLLAELQSQPCGCVQIVKKIKNRRIESRRRED